MDIRLDGRHALVCGASAGIGRAAAVELARLGATVTTLARRKDRLVALRAELLAEGAPDARPLVVDLDDPAAAGAAVRTHLEAHGPVHILVNNAGGPPPGRLLDATPQDFLGALSRHLLAAHMLVGLVLPGMTLAGYGRIVNVISTSVREPIANLGVSNTTRGAMAAWAKTLAMEVPPGVTVNNLLPGFTDTERLDQLARALADRGDTTPEAVRRAWVAQVPEGRLGRPEELGAVIAFLCTPAAAYVRGQSIAVDGGRMKGI